MQQIPPASHVISVLFYTKAVPLSIPVSSRQLRPFFFIFISSYPFLSFNLFPFLSYSEASQPSINHLTPPTSFFFSTNQPPEHSFTQQPTKHSILSPYFLSISFFFFLFVPFFFFFFLQLIIIEPTHHFFLFSRPPHHN